MKATRNIEIDHTRAATESRTVPVVVSSEKPVNRGDYLEVLQHTPDAIDMEREPLPLIECHNGNQVNIGLVEGLRVDNGKLRGTARFGKSNRANELWPDIVAGIVRHVSIAYQILSWDESDDTAPPTYNVTRWTPFECSIVSIPADETVGFYRNKDTDMTDENLSRSDRRAEKKAVEDERERVAAIRSSAETHDLIKLGNRAIDEGWSYHEFNVKAMEEIGEKNTAARSGHTDHGMGNTLFGSVQGPRAELASRSVMEFQGRQTDSLHAFLAGAAGLAPDIDMGPFKERSQEISRITGRKPTRGGVMFPLGALHTRTLAAGAQGGNLIETDLLSGSFIDVLRAKSVVMGLNPTIIPNLVGDAAIPRKTAGTTGYWVNLDGGDSITESDLTLDQVGLSLKSVAGFTKFSHKMLVQSSLSVEQMIREDLAGTLASALDVGAIQGTGASNQPTGIVNTGGINATTYTTAPTFADVVGMEGAILEDNVDLAASIAYLTTPTLSTTLKTTEKATDTAQYIWTSTGSGEGNMNGYRAMATANVPAATVILGKWSDLVIGLWGAVEILVDPYTEIRTGNVSVRAIMDVDVAVRYPQSFCVMAAA